VTVITAGGTGTKSNGFTYIASFTDGAGGMPPTGSEPKHSVQSDTYASTASQGPESVSTSRQEQDEPMIISAERSMMLILETGDSAADCQGFLCDALNTTAAVPNTAPAGAIDLDHNDVPDLCQMRCGDLDLSGAIDEGDLALIMIMIGTDPTLSVGDFDGDGVIGETDVAALLLRTRTNSDSANPEQN